MKNHKKSQKTNTVDLLQAVDNFLSRKSKIIFWSFFSVSVLFTFLLFNLQVSVGGDDSLYIIRASDFITKFTYPTFQGPLYPIILSLFVGIFGINLFILKLISAIFLSAHLYFFYIVFKKHVPPLILFSTIVILSINSNLLYYGSQTYSEALFLLAQILFFMFFFKNFINNNSSEHIFKSELIKFLKLGAIILCLGLVKSIGYSAFIAVVLYFAFEKQWKSIVYTIGAFFANFAVWKLIKSILWSSTSLQFSSQASTLFQKHPYDATKGQEDLMGFLHRIIDNSNIYLSRQLLKILDIRPDVQEVDGVLSALPKLPALTILIYAVLIFAFIWSIKRNKHLMFTGIYLAVIMGVSFVILQTLWESSRLMIVFLPLLILYFFTGIYYLLKIKQIKILQFILPVFATIIILISLTGSTKKINQHQKVFFKHLRGNITAGMTPDWRNYVNMCKWAAKNVAKDKVIACRKPGIAFIYTGRRFQGIYKVPNHDADSLLNNLYDRNIDYVLMASLRKIEAKKTKYTINTIKRYLYYIQLKYPTKLLLIQQVGGDEAAYLFELKKN